MDAHICFNCLIIICWWSQRIWCINLEVATPILYSVFVCCHFFGVFGLHLLSLWLRLVSSAALSDSSTLFGRESAQFSRFILSFSKNINFLKFILFTCKELVGSESSFLLGSYSISCKIMKIYLRGQIKRLVGSVLKWDLSRRVWWFPVMTHGEVAVLRKGDLAIFQSWEFAGMASPYFLVLFISLICDTEEVASPWIHTVPCSEMIWNVLTKMSPISFLYATSYIYVWSKW